MSNWEKNFLWALLAIFAGCLVSLTLKCDKIDRNIQDLMNPPGSKNLIDKSSLDYEGGDEIPSLMEIQERLGVKPDGIYGPETAKKWTRAIGDRNSKQYYKMYDKMAREKK